MARSRLALALAALAAPLASARLRGLRFGYHTTDGYDGPYDMGGTAAPTSVAEPTAPAPAPTASPFSVSPAPTAYEGDDEEVYCVEDDAPEGCGGLTEPPCCGDVDDDDDDDDDDYTPGDDYWDDGCDCQCKIDTYEDLGEDFCMNFEDDPCCT